jgi:hypothetical protein
MWVIGRKEDDRALVRGNASSALMKREYDTVADVGC